MELLLNLFYDPTPRSASRRPSLIALSTPHLEFPTLLLYFFCYKFALNIFQYVGLGWQIVCLWGTVGGDRNHILQVEGVRVGVVLAVKRVEA